MLATTNTSIVLGNYSDIEETAKRIQMLMRGGEKLSNKEVMALAQFSAVTHLNPFIGECWYISGSGPMVGIAGARRLDQERAAEKNGYSFAVVTPCTPEEAGALESEVKDVVAAFKTEINDSGATQEYQKLFTATIQAMREAGIQDPFSAAKEVCGPRPSWVGYGFSKKSDQSRMNKVQLARKRSEADALKKRIVIPFGATVADSDVAPEYVEGETNDVKPELKRGREQNLTELGFAADVKEVDDAFPSEIVTTKTLPRMTYDEAKQVIVKTTNGEKFIGEMTLEQLNKVIEKSIVPASVEAAKIVLAHDFQMEPENNRIPEGQLL